MKSISPLRQCPDVITGVKFSEIKWKGNGFYYCRYSSLEKDKPLTSLLVNPCLYYHRMGTSQEKDSLIFEYPKNMVFGTINFDVLEDERFLILYHVISVKNKSYNQVSFWDFKDSQQLRFKALLSYPVGKENSFHVIGFLNGKFLVYSDQDSPRGRIISFEPSGFNKAMEFVPEYDAILEKAQLIDHKLVCVYLQDLENFCAIFDSTGKVIKRLTYPPGSSISGFEGTNKDFTTLFCFYSFLHPPVAYEFNFKTMKSTLLQKTTVSYEVNDFEMKKIFYESKDGQKIPMILAGKKGLKQDGTVPTILYGYGGNGVSLTPFFDVGFITHMRNGGLVALPAIRGGGEYGKEWHKKGMRENKQNSMDDFIAAAEYLIENKYTCSARLALMGSSNGGMLVGSVLTQRPELFKVAVCNVGVYDMLRYDLYTIGYAWIKEYGTSRDSIQFQHLYKYSPLHTIKQGVKYPAVLIITADHDDRVVPMHSYKFAATLQEKTGGTNPVLLYTQPQAGHYGDGKNGKSVAYMYAFIYNNMGLKPRELSSIYE